MFIEKLESRIAPAAVTFTEVVISSGPGNGGNVSNNPGVVITPNLPAMIVFTAAVAGIDSHTLSPTVVANLTKFPNLRVISDLDGMRGVGEAAGGGLSADLIGGSRAPLSELISPLLQTDLSGSISNDSTLAMLGGEATKTAAFPGAVELLADSNAVVPAFGVLALAV